MVYLNRFFICTFVVIAIVCAVNWFIDPYGMYWSPVIVGINSTKPASGDRVRVIKAYRAPEFAPQVLIVGNSRAEMALHPEHPSFDSARVYNQAMPGAGIRLQTDYARNTIDTTPSLKRVIMSVDYLDFLVRHARFSEPHIEDAAPDYLLRLPLYTPGWSGRAMRLREKSALLFSLDGLLDSVRTVFQQSAAVNSIDPTGFNDPASYVNILRHEGINALFVQKLEGLDGNMRGRDLMTIDSDTGQRSPQYGILADFLADLSEQDIHVQLFISPYHFSYLHLLNDLSMTKDFIAWKYELLKVVEESGANFNLWDFSGPSIFIQEPVPVGSNRAMQWYWEPAHYRRDLGDKILESLATGKAISQFGTPLTKGAIEAVTEAHYSLLSDTRDDWQALQQSLNIDIDALPESQ
ncbi:MAG: hypothetical protein ABJM39_04260 [Porticoccus sp.]|uniref:hypothetical protein n=1 Tax=Porticoccus sp. TaxID=2024853 RepID=UPI000C5D8021|nr:hypothetical protein [Porticoccus sp.]MAZ69737.1 hypothetical protein [Porticoccus sp.]|tara:strand:+ start:2775 stop:3998 length:1224 start_codon:yes stop_codon:yes gene_type:complete